MNRIGMGVALVVLGLATSAAPAQPQAGGLADNAAIQYWQAFAHLPTLDEKHQQLLKDWRKIPLDDAARRLPTEASLNNLHRGAKLPGCAWAMDYDQGFGLLMPHVERSLTLARMACLRARVAFADGRNQEGVDDALAVFALGRHVAADPILISILVGFKIEYEAMAVLADQMPKLPTATLKQISDRLATLPAAATLEQTMPVEKEFMAGWFVRWLKKQKPGNLRAVVRPMLGDNSENVEAVMKLVDDNSAERLIKAVEELQPTYAEMAKIVAMPRDKYTAAWSDLEKRYAANPTARLLLPAIIKCVDRRDNYRAQLAMFKAAIDVVRDGQGALAKHNDPYGQGAFEYKQTPKGFELRSKLNVDNQPATLVVGGQ